MTEIEYELIRSARRSVSIEIKRGGKVIVRAPMKTPTKIIEEFVSSKSEWIEKHKRISEQKGSFPCFEDYSEADIKRLKDEARKTIPRLVDRYAELIGVKPTQVRINRAKARFGSCSAKNSLNFSCFLMLYPAEAVEYVVVHELCHIREHNHSARFYHQIERVMPDFRRRETILKDYNGGEN